MKKIILLMSIFAISCNNDDNSNSGETNCTDQFVYGLHVSVKNAVTNAVLQEGVLVKATDGSYVETLQTEGNSSTVFVGAGERAGSYILTVSKDGYETFTSEVITLKRDECHVISKEVTVALQPE